MANPEINPMLKNLYEKRLFSIKDSEMKEKVLTRFQELKKQREAAGEKFLIYRIAEELQKEFRLGENLTDIVDTLQKSGPQTSPTAEPPPRRRWNMADAAAHELRINPYKNKEDKEN